MRYALLGPGRPGPHGPYYQSERLDLYRSYSDKLLQVRLRSLVLLLTRSTHNPFRVLVRPRLPLLLFAGPACGDARAAGA
jgi:hypothetical protein